MRPGKGLGLIGAVTPLGGLSMALLKGGVILGLLFALYTWIYNRGVAYEQERQQRVMIEVNARITHLNAELDEAHATLERLRRRQAAEAVSGIPDLPACASQCSLPPPKRDALNAVR